MKNIAVLFGGVAPEHEVSIITGLQVIEKIDRKCFSPYSIKLSQEGDFYYYPALAKKKDFLKIKPKKINFGKDEKGAFFVPLKGLIRKKIYLDAAYLAFHGGLGESGQIQGFFEILNLPYTSPAVESSAISMNKALTKEVLERHGIATAAWARVFSAQVRKGPDKLLSEILKILKFPLIVKPVHLGSSIGVKVVNTRVELKKSLLEASFMDSEILVEKFLKKPIEYNVSVRTVNGKIEASEVERPISEDEILSFKDKYQKGGKKTSGMASLNRELPAKIKSSLARSLKEIAVKVYKLTRASGVIRVDMMLDRNQKILVTEVNPIPGSMAYYLWEASGVSFKDQITNLINEAIRLHKERIEKRLIYESDIVEKFVNSKDR